MTKRGTLPEFESSDSKELGWILGLLFVVVLFLILAPGVVLKSRSERKFAEDVLRESKEVKQAFAYVEDIIAVENPARGGRGYGQHAWMVDRGAGYFTLKVQGYETPEDLKKTRRTTKEFRVHFVSENSQPKVTRIEAKPEWIAYGKEPLPKGPAAR